VPDLTYNDCPRRKQTRTFLHTNSVGAVLMKGDLNIDRVTKIYYPTKPQLRLMQNGEENMMPSITIV
jgi:hypothetical protein